MSQMPDNKPAELVRDLCECLTMLDSSSEFISFFEDLCTPAELKSMADRWKVAQKLEQGESYRSIHEKTGVSTTTITRVARSMTYGSDGYKLLLQKKRNRKA